MVVHFIKHILNFILVYKVFFVLKIDKKMSFKKFLKWMIIKELITSTVSLINYATASHEMEYLPAYLIYEGVLGIIMVMHIASEKWLWKYKLILYERDYYKWLKLTAMKASKKDEEADDLEDQILSTR